MRSRLKPKNLLANTGNEKHYTGGRVANSQPVNFASQPKVFIAYSHKDMRWKEYVQSHLQVAEKHLKLTIWDDRQIGTGNAWLNEIERALSSARVALLLVSHHSLTSNFILNYEVASLMTRRAQGGLDIYPLIIRGCDWKAAEWLAGMNLRPEFGKPLAEFTVAKRDSAMAEICREIREIISAE